MCVSSHKAFPSLLSWTIPSSMLYVHCISVYVRVYLCVCCENVGPRTCERGKLKNGMFFFFFLTFHSYTFCSSKRRQWLLSMYSISLYLFCSTRAVKCLFQISIFLLFFFKLFSPYPIFLFFITENNVENLCKICSRCALRIIVLHWVVVEVNLKLIRMLYLCLYNTLIILDFELKLHADVFRNVSLHHQCGCLIIFLMINIIFLHIYFFKRIWYYFYELFYFLLTS